MLGAGGAGTRLTFDIFARDHASDTFDGFGKTVRKTGDDTERTGKKMSGAKKHVAGLVGAFAGFQVIGKATDFLRSANEEARESQKVNARTANVIKTTGGVAKVTASDVGKLATAISNKTAVDDEAVQTGANLLLTFKNVRNEAGKQNRIFDRATAAAVDLSASGFGSIESASKMLGKSLNDPVKGIAALSRAGVTFTSQQKAQIKALVEGGDANAAMAMGLIDSTATYNNLLKQNKGDAAAVADVLTKDLTPAQKKAFDMYAEGNNTVEAQKRIMKEVESQVKGSAASQATATEKMTTSWNNFKEMVGTGMLPVIDKAAGKLTQITNWAQANPGAVKAIAAAFGVLAVAFIALTSPITLVIGALAAMAVGLTYLYTKNKSFAEFVNKAWKNLIQPALKAWWFYQSKVLWPTLKLIFTLIWQAFQKVGGVMLDVWKNKIKPSLSRAREALGGLRDAFRSTRDNIGRVWAGIKEKITAPIDAAKRVLNSFFAGIDKIARFFGKSFKFRFDVGNPGGASNATMNRPRGGMGSRHSAHSAGAIRPTGGKGGAGGSKTWPANTRSLSDNYPGHSGVDIAAANGSPIKAAASGKIQYVGTGRGFGQAIFQSLPGGLSAVYGHTSQTFVQPGQSVRAGQRIGLVGWTGNVRPKGPAGAHLHFEVNGAGPFGSVGNRSSTLTWLGGAKMTKGGGSAAMPSLPRLKLPGWLAPMGGSLLGMAKSWVKGAVFDTGGILPSGQVAMNLSGKPERVLNPRETAELTPDAIGEAVGRHLGPYLRQAVRDELARTTLTDDRGRSFRTKVGVR